MQHKCYALMCISVLAVACSKPDSTPAPSPQAEALASSAGVLIFGDSGYHLDYPDQDDYVDLFSEEEYLQYEYDEWVEDKRPVDEFKARPFTVSPVTGKTVVATGLHRISEAMTDYCATHTVCDFGVMLGDNVYPSGATMNTDGFDDDLRLKHILGDPFGSIVSKPASYTTYVTLGNHDWETSRDGGFRQIDYLQDTDGFYMDGPFYSVKPPGGNGEIELFVIDTGMMLAAIPVVKDALNDDGSEGSTGEIELPDYFVEPMTDAEKNMHLWLEESLKESTARWKLVIAHHPIWSSSGSKFEEARALRKHILPTVCRYADAYIAGHEHTLEIHEDDCSGALGAPAKMPLVELVSGAASKQRPLHSTFMAHQAAKYPELEMVYADALIWGFMHMRIEGDTAHVAVLSIPNDGGSDISLDFEYSFQRRSHLAH